jgi:hypothetical protein
VKACHRFPHISSEFSFPTTLGAEASMPLTDIGLLRMQCEEFCTCEEIKHRELFETAGTIHGNGREK